MRTLALSAFVTAALLSACVTPAPSAVLPQGAWALAHLEGAPDSTARAPTIRFDADRATGFGGCNQWFSEVVHANGAITFTAIGSTKMACMDGGAMQLESAYFSALERTRSAAMAGDNLVFYGADAQEIMRFQRAPPR